MPVAPGPGADNPPFSRPSGGLHMPVRSVLAFGADHLRGALGEPGTLLQPASYRRLQAPLPRAEAMGWTPSPDGGFYHEGSNGYWFMLLRVLPQEGLVICIAANSAGQTPTETFRRLRALSEQLR